MTFPIYDKLSKIENSKKHNWYIIKFIVANKKNLWLYCYVDLICIILYLAWINTNI